MIIGLIMAGGKGTRLKSKSEKPLYKFNNKFLIDYVLDNMYQSKLIAKVLVIVSPHTQNTKDYLIESDFIELRDSFDTYDKYFLDSPGKDYLSDLSYVLNILQEISKDNTLLMLNSDLPFVSSDVIDDVLKIYLNQDKSALSVLIPTEVYDKYNVSYEYEFNGLVPSGLNILKSNNSILDETNIVMENIELAFNLNSIDDISIAYNILDSIEK